MCSILAPKEGIAQTDTNELVEIHSSILCAGCNVQIVARNMTPPYTEIDTVYQTGNACLNSDTAFGATGLNVDTNRKQISGLTLTALSYHPNTSFPCIDGSAYVSDILHIYFDSIPYRDSSGSLIAQGVFTCSVEDSVIAFGSSLHWDCDGSCTETGTALDTLALKIIPISSAVSNSTAKPHFKLSLNGEQVTCGFQISNETRRLELSDLLGRTQAILIPPGISSLHITSLPHGCYFARLGNEVGKFIIPSR